MEYDIFHPYEPRDIRARLIELSRQSDLWTARVWLEDDTGVEGVEVRVQVSDSLRVSHPLSDAAIANAVARHINLWSPQHRLDAARGRASLGGEYVLGGDSELLYVTEPPIAVPA
jgi:hypothetical protein